MNGNCFLVPKSVANLVGEIDPGFTHYLGDYDYGLRARKKNCSIWVIPAIVGTCALSSSKADLNENKYSSKCMLAGLRHPKGVVLNGVNIYSPKEWKLFARRHGGFFWMFFWLLPYRRVLCHCDIVQLFKSMLAGYKGH